MLKKANRLNHAEFAKYFSVGKRIHNTYSTTIYAPAPTLLCAVVVAKKIYKKAHDRNLIRRRFYEVIREIIKEREVTGVYIFLVKPVIKNLTKSEFKKLITLEVGRTLK
ncbi:MAG: ribonuclease P protein component [Candidatus Pacebacteria bacterium]|nr:ribonuclease P protein component [Candidatus Paceibacterota bacterium]